MRRSAKATGQRNVEFTRRHSVSVRLVTGVCLATALFALKQADAQFTADPPKPGAPGVQHTGSGDANSDDQQAFGLPPGLEPPGEPHPSLSINEELITPEEITKFIKESRGDFNQYLYDAESGGSPKHYCGCSCWAEQAVVAASCEIWSTTIPAGITKIQKNRLRFRPGMARGSLETGEVAARSETA